ncbi:unnamed protein product [Orchesella dallaii]|uniref:Uncharacterized protein n=1 Tax=Orchesella dallaii TaxID=48710 RepID=A0ABP1Q6V4_9HEXA
MTTTSNFQHTAEFTCEHRVHSTQTLPNFSKKKHVTSHRNRNSGFASLTCMIKKKPIALFRFSKFCFNSWINDLRHVYS